MSRSQQAMTSSRNAGLIMFLLGLGEVMCKRQIDRRPVPLAPSNDNEPRIVPGPTSRRPAFLRSGILSVVLERTARVRLDLVADGVLTIQGQGTVMQGPDARH
jgi:hypothetical protein